MKSNKKLLIFVGSTIIIAAIIAIPIFLNNDKGVKIEYKKYLSENKILSNAINSYDENLKSSFLDYQNKKITADEYFVKVDEIRKKKENLKTQKLELKKEYKLDKDLDKVVLSDNKKTDEKLKNLFLKNEELEKKDEALDLEEENLEKLFDQNKITEEEFESKKAAIEAKEEELELLEEELDREEELLDVDDDDELDDDNETEDDEQDDDKDTD